MIGRRSGLWIGGLLFAFLVGLTVSRPPVSTAALHDDFVSHSSPAILAGEREDVSVTVNEKDCRSSNASAQEVTRRHIKRAACATAP
jgi:hypothetical protein